MTKRVDFLFDFGSPNAYLAHRVIPAFVGETGADVVYAPVLLGGLFKSTGNQPPMVAYANVPAKMDYFRQEMRRFIARHKLSKFQFHPNFPVNTLLLMRGAVAAEADGTLAPYVEAGMVVMWEDGLPMDDPETFEQVFTKAGLDGAALLERTQDPAIKAALIEKTDVAVKRGAFGIPTFYVGDEMFFGKETLPLVAEAL